MKQAMDGKNEQFSRLLQPSRQFPNQPAVKQLALRITKL